MRSGQSVFVCFLCAVMLVWMGCSSKPPAKETQSVSSSTQPNKTAPANASQAQPTQAPNAPAPQKTEPLQPAQKPGQNPISYAKNPERFVQEETVPAPFTITNPKTAQEHFDVAINDDNHQELDKAIQEYKEALQLQPDWALAHFRMAKDYQKQGRLDDAISEFEQATRSDPNYYEAYYQLALIYKTRGDNDKWAQVYSKVAEYPNAGVQMMAHYELGFWYVKKGDRQKAKEHLEDYRKLALNAGSDEQKTKRYRDALRDLQKLKE